MPEQKKFEEKGVVKLCQGGGCCPKVDFTGENIIITDDYGGRVQLTKQEWILLQTGFKRQ